MYVIYFCDDLFPAEGMTSRFYLRDRYQDDVGVGYSTDYSASPSECYWRVPLPIGDDE